MLSVKKLKWLFISLLTLVVVSATGAVADNSKGKDPSAPIEKLDFQGADIRTVVYFLADYGNVNVVVDPDVKGTVTISVKNVTWKQGLDIIGRTYDLAVVYEDEGYVRILPVDEYRKEITAIERHKKDRRELTPLQTEIVRINNSTAEDVTKAVEGLLTSRGRVTADPRTNSVILQDVPDNLATLGGYIEKLDLPPRQIKISAQLIEVNSNYLFELGSKLQFQSASDNLVGDADFSQTALSDGVTDRVSNPFGDYSFSLIHPDWSLDGIIQTIVGDGKAKILAHPEITTIENKEARIQMGQKIPIKQFDQSGNVTTVFEEVGTILHVTPHITADNQILMEMRPERSFAEISAAGVVISTNNAETNVIVENGQTAVIGGLTTEDKSESEVGVPILKDIPVIGFLFRYKTKRTESRDLIILVTPTIIDGSLANNG